MSAAVIGLGRMGSRIAARICQVYPGTQVWNRSQHVAEEHSFHHGSRCVSALNHIRASTVLTFLPSTVEVVEVMRHMDEPTLSTIDYWVDGTSGHPLDWMEVYRYLRERGIHYMDAPVSGGPAGAEQGTLTTMIGGYTPEVGRLLRTYSAQVIHTGAVGSGFQVKCMNNYLNASQLILGAEVLEALRCCDVDPAVALEAINKSSGRSLMTEVRLLQEVLTHQYNYGFTAHLMHKDLMHARALLPKQHWAASRVTAHMRQVPHNGDYTEATRAVYPNPAVEENPEDDDEPPMFVMDT